MDDIRIRTEGAIGHLILTRCESLNSLTPEMVAALHFGIDCHADDPSVRCIVLTGEGDRGLCAGADIKELHRLGREAPKAALAFWADEYLLNARISHLEKPWVAVMDGICMGGGAGLSMHGSHRIVTEGTRFAMPETLIGYFPDVGATWALPRTPGMLGFWLGLTGQTVGAADVLAAGLADALVPSARIHALLADLAQGRDVDEAIAAHANPVPESALVAQVETIAEALAAPDMPTLIAQLEDEPASFAQETAAILRTRSPTGLTLALHLLQQGARAPDLETCLAREYAGDMLILQQADFYEGIRAAVIDRDRQPRWSPPRIEDVDAAALIGALPQLTSVPHPSSLFT